MNTAALQGTCGEPPLLPPDGGGVTGVAPGGNVEVEVGSGVNVGKGVKEGSEVNVGEGGGVSLGTGGVSLGAGVFVAGKTCAVALLSKEAAVI
jgi:hypothetical protein